MNNFKTEYIINDWSLMPGGKLPEALENNNTILNLGKYGIFSKSDKLTVYHREPQPGTAGKCTITLSAAGIPSTANVTAIRLAFEIKEVGKHTSEFANALTRNAKSICVETNVITDAKLLADKLVELVEAQQKLMGVKLFTIVSAGTSDSATITITCDKYSEVKNCTLAGVNVDLKFTAYSSEVETPFGAVVLTSCKNPFGTAEDLIKNFRLPSLANTNWLALNQDERPIPNVKYHQYVIEKAVERNDVHGIGAVGQKVTSVTTHVFFINENLVSDWESESKGLKLLGVEIKSVSNPS